MNTTQEALLRGRIAELREQRDALLEAAEAAYKALNGDADVTSASDELEAAIAMAKGGASD